MKELLLIVTTAAALSGLSAFGQGYFLFTGPVRGVWDYWSGPSAHPSASNRVAFLWGTGTPQVDAIATSTPTNGSAYYNYSAAWNLILTDPNFHVALNNTDGTIAVAQTAANGAWSYASAQTFPVTGTAVAAYQVFVVGWGGGWANPAAAAAAGAPLGWSAPFTYNAVSVIGTPLSFAQSGFKPFGFGIPEPSVSCLTGLVAAAFLLRRRHH